MALENPNHAANTKGITMPDRDDADQEGRTLPPHFQTRTMEGEQQDYYRLIARDEANRAILQHLRLCPMVDQRIPDRLRALELSFWKLVGFMAGSGILGGLAGALLNKLIH
jgi:hypothetical protein